MLTSVNLLFKNLQKLFKQMQFEKFWAKTYWGAALLLLSMWGADAKAQCEDPTVTRADYCVDQPATIELEDASSNAVYKWYGSLSEDPKYGQTGVDNGRLFTSSSKQNSSASFYYSKNVDEFIGPEAPFSLSGGEVVEYDPGYPYLMNFSATEVVEIKQTSAVVYLEDASATYGIAVRYSDGTGTETDSIYSEWLEFTAADLFSVGFGCYLVDIPVDFYVEAGTGYSLEIISNDDGHEPVDGFYWWGEDYYPTESFFSGWVEIENPTIDYDGVSRSPLICDWQTTFVCERKEVVTELGKACCAVVGDDVKLTASSNEAPSPTNAVTITAAGSDLVSGLYYAWFDPEGNSVGGGVDQNTVIAESSGQYVLKVLHDPYDYENPACFTRKTITLGTKTIFAPDDFSVCLGEPITLRGEGAEGGYNWLSEDPVADSYIAEHNVQITDLVPLKPGTYTYTVEGDVKLGNVVEDGKFEFYDSKDPVFETAYTIKKAAPNGGEYEIVNGPFPDGWGGLVRCPDPEFWTKYDPKTDDVVSRGNIYIANGIDEQPEPKFTAELAMARPLWKQTFSVVPDSTYHLSVDVANWNAGANPPNIMVVVNGLALELSVDGGGGTLKNDQGDYYYAFPAGKDDEWEVIEATWTADTDEATMYIAEVSNQEEGHEFAMDDITFYLGRGKQTDDVTITVEDCNILEARADGEACIGDKFDLSLVKTNGFLLDWADSKGKVISTKENASAFPLKNETYTARAKFPFIPYIKNGTFATNNLDFDLEYSLAKDIYGGKYAIDDGTNTRFGNNDFTDFDNTYGQSLILFPKVDSSIISKTIPVVAGEDYVFTFMLDHIFQNLTETNDYPFEILVDGKVVKTITLPSNSDWINVTHVWNATESKNVEVEFRMGNVNAQNLIAVDNITLAMLGREATDEVDVSASLCNTITLSDACIDESLKEVYQETDGVFMGWYESNGVFISDEDTLRLPELMEPKTIIAKVGVSTETLNTNSNMDASENADGYDMDGRYTVGQYSFQAGDYTYLNDLSKISGGSSYFSYDDFDGLGGNYLLQNPKTGTEQVLLRTEGIPVEANAKYMVEFAVAYANLASYTEALSDLSPLKVLVDGVEIGEITLSTDNVWQNFSSDFISASSSDAIIEIVTDKSSAAQNLAYAIDAFKVRPVVEVLQEEIEIEPCTPPCNKPESISITTPDAICEGDDVTVVAEYADGGYDVLNGSMNYVWYADGDTPGAYTEISGTETVIVPDEVISGLTETTTYILRVEDGTEGKEFCYLEESVEIQVDQTFTVSLGDDQNICDGKTATIDAGIEDAAYEWSNAETTQTITVSDADTYTVTVTDGACSAEGSVDVTITPIPTVNISPEGQQNICDGQTVDFTASVDETGTWEYEFYKDAGIDQTKSATDTYSTAEAGEYYAMAYSTVNEECFAESDKVTVQLDGKPTVNLITDTEQVCDGTAELTVNVGSGDWQYEFFDSDGNSVQALSSTNTYTVSTAGTYSAYAESVDNSACFNNSDPITIEIGETPVVSLDEANSTLAYCVGGSGTIAVTEVADVTYSWSDSEGAVSGSSHIIENVSAETYSVEVSSGFCSTTVTDIVVEEKEKPSYTFSGTATVCEGGETPSVTLELTGVGPWDIEYNDGTQNVTLTVTTATETLSPSVTTAGEYEFTMVSIYDNGADCAGEITTSSATITIVKPEFTFNDIDSECENGSNVDVSKFVDGTGTFEYSCTQGAFINDATGEFDVAASGSGVFDIVAVMTDDNDCKSDELSKTLEVWEAPLADISGDAFVCADKTTVLNGNPTNGTSPYSVHEWTGDVSPLASTTDQEVSFDPSSKGIFALTYTVTDANGCTGSSDFEVEVGDIPTAAINVDDKFCSTDLEVILDETQATVSIDGGTMSWKIDEVPSTEIDPAALSAGTHTITLDYDYSCPAEKATAEFEVVFAETPKVTPVSCLVDEVPHADLIAEGDGTSFSWYANETDPANEVLPLKTADSFNPAHTEVGNYTYYLTQMINGCESQPVEALIEISDCPTPKPAVDQVDPICAGDATPALKATGSGTIRWYSDASKQNQVGTGDSYTPDDVTEGDNVYYVTQDNNDCEGLAQDITITVNPIPVLTFGLQDEICQEEDAIILSDLVNPTGGDFEMGGSSLSSFDPSSFEDESKTIEYSYTDANNCSNSLSKDITVNATPQIAITNLSDNYCGTSDDVVLEFSGENGGTASWSSNPSGAISSGTFRPSAFADLEEVDVTVSLEYSDVNGCQAQVEAETKVYGTIKTIQSEEIAAPCESAESFDLAAYLPAEAVAGGDYSGTGLSAGSVFNPSIAGSGDHTILYIYTDPAISCPAQVEFEISVKPLPIVSFSPEEHLCVNSTPIILSEYVESDKVAESMQFNGDGVFMAVIDEQAFDPNASSTGPGIYTISVEFTDVDGCKATEEADIIVHGFPVVDILGEDKVCENSSNKVYRALPEGDATGYVYDWKIENENATYNKDGEQISVNWGVPDFATVHLSATDQFGCVGEAERAVSVAEHPEADFSWSKAEASYEAIEYDLTFRNLTKQPLVTENGVAQDIEFSTEWDFSSSVVSGTETQDYALKDFPINRKYPFGEHEVEITVTNDHGCVDVYAGMVSIEIETGLYMANSFAPDHASSGVNSFKPIGFNLEEMELWIYDAWGNTVFYTDKLDKGRPAEAWDGTFEGNILPTGVYTWRMRAKFINDTEWRGVESDEEFTKFGTVFLLR